MAEDIRPDPDALLAAIQKSEAATKRGKFKVFLGMAAGVGKTYAMLRAAQRAQREGVDVVVGYVETHGRKETEALAGRFARHPPPQSGIPRGDAGGNGPGRPAGAPSATGHRG